MDTPELSIKEKLVSETARIAWCELQRFFAQGVVIVVANELDLIDVAVMFAEDNVASLGEHTESGAVSAPSNEQARVWYDTNAELWSVVVAPYVLVQSQNDATKP